MGFEEVFAVYTEDFFFSDLKSFTGTILRLHFVALPLSVFFFFSMDRVLQTAHCPLCGVVVFLASPLFSAHWPRTPCNQFYCKMVWSPVCAVVCWVPWYNLCYGSCCDYFLWSFCNMVVG